MKSLTQYIQENLNIDLDESVVNKADSEKAMEESLKLLSRENKEEEE